MVNLANDHDRAARRRPPVDPEPTLQTLADARVTPENRVLALDELSMLHAAFDDAAGPARRSTEQPRSPRRRQLLLAGNGIGVSIGGLQMAGQLGWTLRIEGLLADHAASFGEQRRVAIGPGIAVDLDGGSARDVPATGTAVLRSGAAVFRITGEAGETAFRVRAGPAGIETREAEFAAHFTTGSIDVSCTSGVIGVASGWRRETSVGTRVRFWEGGMSDPVDVPRETIARWRERVLVVRDRSITEVAGYIYRHRRGRIILLDQSVGARRIGGTVDLRRPEGLVPQLAAIAGRPITELPGRIAFIRWIFRIRISRAAPSVVVSGKGGTRAATESGGFNGSADPVRRAAWRDTRSLRGPSSDRTGGHWRRCHGAGAVRDFTIPGGSPQTALNAYGLQAGVAVVTGEELDVRGDLDLYDIVERIPDVTQAFGEKGFAIRGIDRRGLGSGGTGRLVTSTVDGVSLPNNQGTFLGP